MSSFTKKHEIRFNDVDLAGHVHNAVYLVYFEQARITWFDEVIGPWDWSARGLVVARNEIDYKQMVRLRDDLATDVWLESVGTKSFTLAYRTYKTVDGEQIDCATGKSVLVCIDYKTGETMVIPDEWREKFIPSASSPKPQ